MPRPKYKPTDPKHVNPVEKMKRVAKSLRKGKSAKPRVRLGTDVARTLGIR